MRNTPFTIVYELDRERAPSAMSLDEQRETEVSRFLFGPVNQELLKFLPSNNNELNADSMKALLLREDKIGEFLRKLESGNADFRELEKMSGLKINGLELSSLVLKSAAENGLSLFGYLNSVFGTNITPETKVKIDGGTMTLVDAFIYATKKQRIQEDTKSKLPKVLK